MGRFLLSNRVYTSNRGDVITTSVKMYHTRVSPFYPQLDLSFRSCVVVLTVSNYVSSVMIVFSQLMKVIVRRWDCKYTTY